VGVDVDFGASTEVTQSKGTAKDTQNITNTDYGYRMPSIESNAQNARAQISLIDEKWATFMASQNLHNLETVLTNELQSIDCDIYRLQVAYLDTLLMSPIVGMVTGVYKHPGDPVSAGEPVLRIESTDQLLLTGTVIYPGPITPSVTVATIQTNMFDAGGPPTSFSGKVVAARGYRQDNEWQIAVRLDSSGNGLPLGYRFDYDDTTISFA
jgi:biotin carboxyl carrier protein